MRRRLWLRRLAVALGTILATTAWGTPGGMRAWAEVRNPKGVALIIGNGDYEDRDVPEVAYAHRDAEAFRGYVLSVLGFDPENIIDVRDATRRMLYDALGKRGDPSGSLLWSYLDPDGGSEVVVYYSGHGVPGQRDGRGYLLPVDTDPKAAEDDGYPIDLLYKNLGSLAEAKSVRVFLDACFSGGSHEGGLIGSASPVFVKAALPEEAAEKVTSLTAASGKQIASWDDKARHGLFTHHLLDALYGKADEDKDGTVTAQEAKQYLDRRMTRAARRVHRRVQKASLMGSGEVVLGSAAEGQGFPVRPALDAGSGASRKGKGEGTATAGGKVVSLPVPEPAPPSVPETPDHVAAEAALGLSSDARILIQRGLAMLKLGVGYPDGLFGKKTRGAIEEWQEGKGLPATGYLTREQAEALTTVGKVADREEAQRVEKEKAERERRSAERERLAREAKARAAAERQAREESRPGRVFRDCGECPEMVVIPAGEFMMGSPDWETGRFSDEGPRHRVRIPEAMAVGKFEVTFEEWDTCVAGGGCGGHRPRDAGWGRGRHPVINVSWEDAKAYVGWLSGRTGKGYRLMSEAEWEYAARAGTAGPFHFGSTITTDVANYDGNHTYGSGDKGVYRQRTVAVGSFPANDYGLHDVHGNVREWVEDCRHEDYGGAPMEGEAWVTGGDCNKRVLRGGSWYFIPGYLRSAIRRFRDSAGFRSNNSGFRVARTLTP